MKNYLKSFEVKGAIREINKRIEFIIDTESFIYETTTIGDYPDKRSFIKISKGKEIIDLAQTMIDVVKDFYKEN